MSIRATVTMVILVLAACHHDRAVPQDQRCEGKLAELAQFFVKVAADQEASPLHAQLEHAEVAAGLGTRALVTVAGPPADTSKSDYLVVGPEDTELVTVAGDTRSIRLDSWVPIAGPTRALVIAISPTTPWRVVKVLYQALANGDPPDRYGPISFAYRTDSAFAGRTPPSVEGATAGSVDLPLVLSNIAKETTANCPEVAADADKLKLGARLDAAMLRAMAADLPKCRCSVHLAMLEVIPWLARTRVTTVLPLQPETGAASFPAAKDDASFEEVVRANGGRPLVFVQPPTPPPPPPPPPPPKR
jgi:hypothetical protein